MGAADETMPPDPVWSWRAGDEQRNDTVAVVAAVAIFGAGGFLAGLLAQGWGSAASWLGLVAGVAAGLLLGGLVVGLGRRRERRTWVVLTPDGRLVSRALRKHDEIDVRAEGTVHVAHLISETAGGGGAAPGRFAYTLVGAGPTPRFKGVGGDAPAPGAAVLDGGIRVPAAADHGLVEALASFAEVVEVPSEIALRGGRVTRGLPTGPT